MKRISSVTIGVLSTVFLANLSQQTSVDTKHYPDVNFKGTIQTRSGTTLDVENILIAGKYKQIPVYEMAQTKNEQQRLAFDPSDKKHAITSYLDLAEIKSMRVENPTVWAYQKERGYAKIEFVEVIVTNNNPADPEKRYLMKLTNTITCDEINKSGPIEKVVPFTAITNLAITDFKAKNADAAEYGCLQECRNKCRK